MVRTFDRGGARPACRRGTRVFVPVDGGTLPPSRVPVGPAGLAVFDRRAPGAGGQQQSADRHRPAAGRARGDGDPCRRPCVRSARVDWRPHPRQSAGACHPHARRPAGGRAGGLRAHRLAACSPSRAGTARRHRRGVQDRSAARPGRRRRAWAGTGPRRAACLGRRGTDPWPAAPPDRLCLTCPDRAPPRSAVRDRRGTRLQRSRSHEVQTHVAACGRRSEVCERTLAAPSWAHAEPAPCVPPDPLIGRRGAGRQLLRPRGDAVHALAWQSP